MAVGAKQKREELGLEFLLKSLKSVSEAITNRIQIVMN